MQNVFTKYYFERVIKIFWKVLDYIIVPSIMMGLLYEPNILKGYVDIFETGQYLACVDAIFAGKVPYKDFFVLFGPFQLYAIAFWMFLFGFTVSVWKIYFYTTYLASFILIYILCRYLFKRRLFAILATFICIVEVSNPYWSATWDFGRMGLGLAVMLAMSIFIRTGNARALFASGAISAFTVFYTLDVGIVSSATCIFVMFLDYMRGRDSFRLLVKDLLIYICGFALVALPFLVYMLFQGALWTQLKEAFYIIPRYHLALWGQPVPSITGAFRPISGANAGIGPPPSEIIKIYMPLFIYLSAFIYLVSSYARGLWSKETRIIALFSIYGAFVYKNSFRAIMWPQFQVALPPLVILVMYSIENMIEFRGVSAGPSKGRGTAHIVFGIGLLLLSLLYFFWSPKRFYGTFPGWVHYQLNKNDFIPSYRKPVPKENVELFHTGVKKMGKLSGSLGEAEELSMVTSYIEKTQRRRRDILFSDQGLSFLSATFASRFNISLFACATPEWRGELLADLQSKKPRMVILGKRLSTLAVSTGRQEEVLPEIAEYIRNNYYSAAEYGSIIIYLRK